MSATTDRVFAATFAVAQMGSRMHYGVPRALNEAGALARLYTDICGNKGWPRLLRGLPRRCCPASMRRLIDRIPEGVPPERIVAFTGFGLEYGRRRASIRNSEQYEAVHLWAGRTFCEAIVRHGVDAADGVYAFNSAGLELLNEARRRGLVAILEQTIAPRPIEDGFLIAEHARFPGWEKPIRRGRSHDLVVGREQAEWNAADLIVCGSAFVRDGIRACGGPVDRCIVIPYGVNPSANPVVRCCVKRPLRVLTVGAVGLRKGSPHVLAAATLLGTRAEFRLVGPITAQSDALRAIPMNVDLIGPVPRSEIHQHYAWADVFLLPTLCEGSATASYEALAAGLPVITTANAGSVVRHGVEGFLVPIRDPEAIAAALTEVIATPDVLCQLSRAAADRSREFTIAAYRDRLVAALRSACASQSRSLERLSKP